MDEARREELRQELLRRELEKRQQEKPAEEPNVFQKALGRVQDFSEGIGVSGLETYYGAKDLLGLGSAKDKQTLEAWRRAAGESGWGTAGQITGDVAQYLLPAGISGLYGDGIIGDGIGCGGGVGCCIPPLRNILA